MQNPSSAMLVRAGIRVRIIGFPRIGSLRRTRDNKRIEKNDVLIEAKALSTHKAAKVSAQRFSVLARLIFRPSRKTMHRPNDRYSVDGDRAATLLGADHMRQFRRPDRSRRIYFR